MTKPTLAIASHLMGLECRTESQSKLASGHLLAGKMLVLEVNVAVQAVDHTFMLKCLRPLPLLRPAGAGSPPEFEPLEGLPLYPQQNISPNCSCDLSQHS